jgi:hypothetical protein
MPIVRFRGRVLPSVVQVSFTDIPKVNWRALEIEEEIGFAIRITKSVVEVDCEIGRYRDEYLANLHMRAFDLARVCVDLSAFSTGHSLSVYFHTFAKPDGTVSPLLFTNPALAKECTVFKANPVTPKEKKNFENVITMVMSEPGLFMALNDLIQANSLPHHGPANCARVVEGLRTLMSPGIERAKAWLIFRENLNTDEKYLSFITGYSTGPRHGDRAHISGAITIEIVTRTWVIMNRYLEFKNRGSTQLLLKEFPLLQG